MRTIVLLLFLVAFSRFVLPLVLLSLGNLAIFWWNAPRLALALGNAGRLLATRALREDAHELELYARRLLLDEAGVMKLVDRSISRAHDGALSLHGLNGAADSLVAFGHYERALALEPEARWARAREKDDGRDWRWLLFEVNLAEADYNVGRWDAALARLEGMDAIAQAAPITRAALWLQRSWILAHLGRGDEAWAAATRMKREELPPLYRAEFHFSRAAARQAQGRIPDALREIREARRLARRPSSVRNALFFEARLAAAQERWADAARLCEEAAAHPWRWQGGDGLLTWGEALLKLNDRPAAERAFRLCVERDPESESAARARARLAVTDTD